MCQLTPPQKQLDASDSAPSPDSSLPSSFSKRSNRPLKYTLCSRDRTQQSHSCTLPQHGGTRLSRMSGVSPVTPLQLVSQVGSSSKLLPLAPQPP